jgi:hypothetical protein
MVTVVPDQESPVPQGTVIPPPVVELAKELNVESVVGENVTDAVPGIWSQKLWLFMVSRTPPSAFQKPSVEHVYRVFEFGGEIEVSETSVSYAGPSDGQLLSAPAHDAAPVMLSPGETANGPLNTGEELNPLAHANAFQDAPPRLHKSRPLCLRHPYSTTGWTT